MAESFFSLSPSDQREALAYARAQTGRPAHLLEKDVWVVWVLHALFDGGLRADLTFKGGTSLSKVYKVIDRFSEDIDLTYDIRKLIPDLIGTAGDLPSSRSQASKWTQAVRHPPQPMCFAPKAASVANATPGTGTIWPPSPVARTGRTS